MSKSDLVNSELTRRVFTNIDRLQRQAGLTTPEMISRTSMSLSTYYERRRLENALTLTDMEEIAAVFDLDASLLMSAVDDYVTRNIRIDGEEFSRRLLFLTHSRGLVTTDTIVQALQEADIPVSIATWNRFTLEKRPISVEETVLRSLADFFSVDPVYFLKYDDPDGTARIEAEVQLRDAISKAGVNAMNLRSFEDLSTEELKSLAALISTNRQ